MDTRVGRVDWVGGSSSLGVVFIVERVDGYFIR
jgi:hypothetical protein